MKLKRKVISAITEIICLLFVLLFIYAAMSKLMDFENFQMQVGQSPLLSAFAWWVSWMIPVIEILIAIGLMLSRYRNFALLGAFSLMLMFTAYIFIILNYSSFVPCSCGGILEKMSWKTHLIFNVVFVLLAFLALLFQHQAPLAKNIMKLQIAIPVSVVSSVALIVVLFWLSEEIMHHKNPFIRRYDRRTITFVQSKDLKVNSYYFAGYLNGQLYLGNYTAPLQILVIDSTFKFEEMHQININYKAIPFRSIKIFIKGKNFYLTDGTVPSFYYGNTSEWKGLKSFKNIPRFTSIVPIDSTGFVFRNNSGEKSANIIGIYSNDSTSPIQYAPELLQKQIDGIFDTDGMLQYDQRTGKIVFVYYYRNEFFTADKKAVLLKRGHTIDTVSKARIKVATLRDGTRKKMAAPPLVVNAKSAVKNDLLFVESKIQGQYENELMWKYASVIDVYNLQNNSYVLSFPIYGIKEEKLYTFFVTETHFYAIVGTKLLKYKLNGILRKEIKYTSNL